jgi:hypothetical protein
MKRLLLTLSLICFSWGAGAYQEDNVIRYKLKDFVDLEKCINAKKHGYEWSSNIFLYSGDMYILQTPENNGNFTTIRCDWRSAED